MSTEKTSATDTLKKWVPWMRERLAALGATVGFADCAEKARELCVPYQEDAFVAIMDLISEVGSWKAKYEKTITDFGIVREQRNKAEDQLKALNGIPADIELQKKFDQAMERISKLEAQIAENA